MKHISFALLMILSLFGNAVAAGNKLSNKQVKQQIIQESIDNYSGSCACPYNSARNGSNCGKRSAWSRAGGASPICYESEITNEMIAQWREYNESTPADSLED